VLQSLVENAITHGVVPLGRCGTVEIRVHRREDQLVLRVEDDGVGMRNNGSAGTGLANARRRMNQLYGNQQSLSVTGAPGQGVSAIACIPFRLLPREPEKEVVSREYSDTDSGRRGARAPEPVVSSGSRAGF
jgi:LytS/YehU family sensor histidine kinase